MDITKIINLRLKRFLWI